MPLDNQAVSRVLCATGGKACWSTRPLAELQQGFARVQTLFSGISSGTELTTLRETADDVGGERMLGYQAVGRVLESRTNAVAEGQLVACYGGPYVHHGSILDVPKHLLTPLPDGIDPAHAAQCGLGTIAMHAYRCGGLALGEIAVVLGLGMLGNLVAQVSRAGGAQLFAVDPNENRSQLATALGLGSFSELSSLQQAVKGASLGNGADAVFVCANQCSDQLLAAAFALVRRCGTVVLVGQAEAKLPRELMFQTEARLVVARAGGPGRYDTVYELDGVDYPYEHARWTEHRNLQEFTRLLKIGVVRTESLIEIVPVSQAEATYEKLQANTTTSPGLVFDWSS